MKKPLTILQASRFLFDRGGAQACFLALNGLLMEKGHRVIPITGGDSRSKKTEYDRYFVPRYSEDNYSQASLREKIKMAVDAIYSIDVLKIATQVIREHKPDIADIHNIYYQISPSIFMPLHKAGIPIVQHLHDYAMFCSNGVMERRGEICDKCMGHRYYNAIIYRCYHDSIWQSTIAALSKTLNNLMGLYDPLVSRYVVTSRFQKDILLKAGIKNEKLEIIPLFFDGSHYPPIDGDEEKVIIFFGEMKFRKGPHVLYEAAKKMKDFQFVFIGDGPMQKLLKHRASQEGMNHVRFYSFIPKEKLFMMLRRSYLVVFPSIFYESFGRVIIESFYYGKPVIGSAVGAIPEVIEDGKSGLLFKPGSSEDLCQKLILLTQDREMRHEMGRYAQNSIREKYSKELYYERLMNLYESLL